MLSRWAAAICCCAAASANDLAGSQACKSCHPAQYSTQTRSHHAFALRRVSETALPTLLSSQPLRERSGISFEYTTLTDGVRVTATQGGRSASAILEWAFGAGAQAITPVASVNGHYLEHRISWYVAAHAPRRTLGHPGEPSKAPEAALGIVQSAETIYRCFNCHATGVKPGPDLTSMIPGVACERCHGAARDHAAAKAIMTPARLSRQAVLDLCGSCHRLPEGVSTIPEAEDPLSIRFAPVGLTASACYRKSRSLSCVTCHNPHEDTKKDKAFYTAKCVACHEAEKACAAGFRNDCVGCHMQQRSPAAYLTFTDHRIRVYPRKPKSAESLRVRDPLP